MNYNIFYKKKFTSFFALMLLCASSLYANNLKIENVTLEDRDITANTVVIEFDISWDNSWRDAAKYDAVWLFVKGVDSGSVYAHMNMEDTGVNPAGTSPGSFGNNGGLEIYIPADKTGAFIRRMAEGSGTVSSKDVRLKANYSSGSFTDTESIIAQLFGIEMAYVTAEPFYAGDGSNPVTPYNLTQGAADFDPWYISSEGTIRTDGTNNYFTASALGDNQFATGAVFTVPAAFPKGYAAFYIMKYEITEGQWVAFFNTLIAAQQTTRDITSNTNGGKNTDSTVTRNTISWSSGDATTNRPNRAMSFIDWRDLSAYLDWAALRPMTELEFEKACRGPVSATAAEYAWGNTTATLAATFSISPEDGTETIATASANLVSLDLTFSQGDDIFGIAHARGPVRAGIFATGSTTRTQAGAGYYGAMELSGNVRDAVVTIGNTHGHTFTGNHGDGVLTTTTSYEGNANVTDWVGTDATAARGVTGKLGSGGKGSDWNLAVVSYITISDRIVAAFSVDRGLSTGGRGVRTDDE